MLLRSVMAVIVAMVIASGLFACGQKGPLYLPDSDKDKKAEILHQVP